MTSEFAVWALGADRPGIVASVTGVLFQRGCNLKDCSMTVLSGHFAMMMLVEASDDLVLESLEADLAKAEGCAELTLAVRPAGEATSVLVGGDHYVVSVYGSDRPGIMHRIATVLAEHRANITDVNTRVIGGEDEPIYAMLLEVTLPPGLDPAVLEGALQVAARAVGVEAGLHAADADAL
ncbi:MAG: glycine cleavage system protein R [Acidimicrobiia bacterium]